MHLIPPFDASVVPTRCLAGTHPRITCHFGTGTFYMESVIGNDADSRQHFLSRISLHLGLHSNNQSSCTNVYTGPHQSAPAYLTDELCQVADVQARQRLRSSSSSSLIVSRTRLLTVGDRAFPVTAALVWNSLTDHVTSAPSVAVFRSRLNISYPCDCTVPAQ